MRLSWRIFEKLAGLNFPARRSGVLIKGQFHLATKQAPRTPRKTMRRFVPFRDHKCLIASANYCLYLELLEGLNSLRKWIFDHCTTASSVEAISGDLAAFLVR